MTTLPQQTNSGRDSGDFYDKLLKQLLEDPKVDKKMLVQKLLAQLQDPIEADESLHRPKSKLTQENSISSKGASSKGGPKSGKRRKDAKKV